MVTFTKAAYVRKNSLRQKFLSRTMIKFSLLSIYTRRQAFLRVLKFFEKRHTVFPQHIVRSSHRKVLYGQQPWTIHFRDAYIQISVLSIFETNQGLTILKKHLEELNWYLLSTTLIHHECHVNVIRVQSFNTRTISLVFVSFCHEVLE